MGVMERLNPRGRHATRVEARDGRGRVLQIDDEVMLLAGHPSFRVTEIRPVLDPKLPPGMVQVILTAYLPLITRSGFPDPEIVRISTAEEVHERMRARGIPVPSAPPEEPPTPADTERPPEDTKIDDEVPPHTIIE